MDRRVEKAEELKEMISDALFELLEQKPLEALTVLEITNRAGVGRVSYFRYFDSLEQALEFKGRVLWQRWLDANPGPPGRLLGEDVAPQAARLERAEWVLSFFDTAEVRPRLALLCWRLSPGELLNVFLAAGYPTVWAKKGEPQYAAALASYGLYGLLVEWARTGFAENPAELARRYVGAQEQAFIAS